MLSNPMQQWLTALRSGEYEQGEGQLVQPSVAGGFEYCCLGVAGKVVFDLTAKNMRGQSDLTVDRAAKLGLNKEITGPERMKLREKFGITSSLYNDRQSVCIRANDTKHMTFEQIAEMIEVMGWDKESAA